VLNNSHDFSKNDSFRGRQEKLFKMVLFELQLTYRLPRFCTTFC